jgi:hypothetical protein
VTDPKLILIAIAVVTAMVLLLFVIWVWWELPKWQVNRLALEIRDPKERARRMTMSTSMKDKLVAERLYDRETCDMMSDAEAETLWRLHQEIGPAFDAVCDAYVASLGLEESQLSDKQRADIVDQVEDLVDDYDDGRYPKETTPLMECLKRHHDLGQEISNIRHDLSTRFPLT